MTVRADQPRRRSFPKLIAVCMIPAILAGALGAMAIGGVHALTSGVVFGVVLGALAVLIGLFIGWLSRRI